ncbi:MAG: SIR2 family protein [Planctomycetota bacterium]
MEAITEQDRVVLSRYSQAIMHLRDRKRTQRLILGLGAGVSQPLNFPSWPELVSRLEGNRVFQRFRLAQSTGPLALRAQALFHCLEKLVCGDKQPSAEDQRQIRQRWIKMLHRALYKGVPSSAASLRKHPYLTHYLQLIRDAPLTINYNFDDSLERLLDHRFPSAENDNTRVYETIWEPSTQFRRARGVIYHPNGFLPHSLVEGFSDHIVFSEGDFADQLIDSMAGHYATLVSHLTRYTCLVIGLSLSDATLKHLLRQNTHLNPGHIHYHVRHREDDDAASLEQDKQEALANFDLHGVVTLHLSSSGICSLGRLLNCTDEDFVEALDDCGLRKRRVYYVSGAVGCGKSTVVQKLRSLTTLTEWTEEMPRDMQKEPTVLSTKDRDNVDLWVSKQFRRKNFRIRFAKDYVILCDRTPLDPLAFVERRRRPARASKHLEAIRPNNDGEAIEAGQVILLTASAEELMARAKERLRGHTLNYLTRQQETFRELFRGRGVVEISTSSRSVSEVLRQVSRFIHCSDYEEFDVEGALRGLGKGLTVKAKDRIGGRTR